MIGLAKWQMTRKAKARMCAMQFAKQLSYRYLVVTAEPPQPNRTLDQRV